MRNLPGQTAPTSWPGDRAPPRGPPPTNGAAQSQRSRMMRRRLVVPACAGRAWQLLVAYALLGSPPCGGARGWGAHHPLSTIAPSARPSLGIARDETIKVARWQWSPKALVFCRLASRAVSERNRHLNQFRMLRFRSTGAVRRFVIPR